MPGSLGALEVLVDGLFDYAGMFPPAALSFDEALAASVAFPHELKRPSLVGGDLVLSFEHLARVRADLLQRLGFDQRRSFIICVLGSALQNSADDNRALELNAVSQFNAEGAGSEAERRVVSYEIKLGAALQADHHALIEVLRRIQLGLQDQPLTIFVEPDLSGLSWDDVLESTCGVIQTINEDSTGARIGLKIRASGPTAVTPQKLCAVVSAVAAGQLHFKATAGLHHPIIERARYHNELGFLNLAAALAFKRHFGSAFEDRDVLACLTCEQASAYSFQNGLHWNQHVISENQIELLRQNFHFSIGSCSLHEPDQDLLRLFG